MSGEIGSTCDVCGTRKQKANGRFGPCGLCDRVARLMSSTPVIMEWVQAVATKAAEDAVLRHENEEERG